MLELSILIFHVFLAIALIALVLLQQGKGADAGAAFGSGASATVFGARGAANFLSRLTAVLAATFFLTSLTLAYLYGHQPETGSVIEQAAPAPPALIQDNSDKPGVTVKPPMPAEPAGQERREDSASETDQGPSDLPDLPRE